MHTLHSYSQTIHHTPAFAMHPWKKVDIYIYIHIHINSMYTWYIYTHTQSSKFDCRWVSHIHSHHCLVHDTQQSSSLQFTTLFDLLCSRKRHLSDHDHDHDYNSRSTCSTESALLGRWWMHVCDMFFLLKVFKVEEFGKFRIGSSIRF